jgi:hypothetical protein
MYRVFETNEYVEWFNEQSRKDQAQIHARINGKI